MLSVLAEPLGVVAGSVGVAGCGLVGGVFGGGTVHFVVGVLEVLGDVLVEVVGLLGVDVVV